MAQVVPLLVVIVVGLVRPLMRVGVVRVSVVPSPICPEELLPQQ